MHTIEIHLPTLAGSIFECRLDWVRTTFLPAARSACSSISKSCPIDAYSSSSRASRKQSGSSKPRRKRSSLESDGSSKRCTGISNSTEQQRGIPHYESGNLLTKLLYYLNYKGWTSYEWFWVFELPALSYGILRLASIDCGKLQVFHGELFATDLA